MTEDSSTSPWMTSATAAAYLGISLLTLARWRKAGWLTAYTLPGTRTVRFARREVATLLQPQNPA